MVPIVRATELCVSRDLVDQTCPGFAHIVGKEAKQADNCKYLEKLEAVSSTNFGFQIAFVAFDDLSRRAGREATRRDILLEQLVFLIPSLSQPHIELLQGIQRDVINAKSAPVEIN